VGWINIYFLQKIFCSERLAYNFCKVLNRKVVNLNRIKSNIMYGEAKKLHLIDAIIKIENDAILTEVETIIAKSNLVVVPQRNFKKFAGMLTDEEAVEFKNAINEGCEKIHNDDWK
jgi:hypothetical protein